MAPLRSQRQRPPGVLQETLSLNWHRVALQRIDVFFTRDRCAHYERSGAQITPAVREKGREGRLRSHPKSFHPGGKWILD